MIAERITTMAIHWTIGLMREDLTFALRGRVARPLGSVRDEGLVDAIPPFKTIRPDHTRSSGSATTDSASGSHELLPGLVLRRAACRGHASARLPSAISVTRFQRRVRRS